MCGAENGAGAPDPHSRQVFGVAGGLEPPRQVYHGIGALEDRAEPVLRIGVSEINCVPGYFAIQALGRRWPAHNADEVVSVAGPDQTP